MPTQDGGHEIIFGDFLLIAGILFFAVALFKGLA